jgi:Immunity protein Imm1
MRKHVYFDRLWDWRWPDPNELERYFLAPPGKEWFYEGGNDSASVTAEGLHGTQHLEIGKGRIDLSLMMWGNPKLGVLLIYSKRGGGYKELYSSKGDLNRLQEWVRSLHDTPLPVGLFIPFGTAWKAVKEFIETDGELPKSIEWIANRDLPPNTFPDP